MTVLRSCRWYKVDWGAVGPIKMLFRHILKSFLLTFSWKQHQQRQQKQQQQRSIGWRTDRNDFRKISASLKSLESSFSPGKCDGRRLVRLHRRLLRPGAAPVGAEISAGDDGSAHRILQPENRSGSGSGWRGVVSADPSGLWRHRKGRKPQITLLTIGSPFIDLSFCDGCCRRRRRHRRRCRHRRCRRRLKNFLSCRHTQKKEW